MKTINCALGFVLLLAPLSAFGEVMSTDNSGGAAAAAVVQATTSGAQSSVLVLQESARSVSRSFEVKNANDEVVEVKLSVKEPGPEEETPVNRDITILVETRCKATGVQTRFIELYRNDLGTCVFNGLAYNSQNNKLQISYTDPRMGSQGALVCDKSVLKEYALNCTKAPPTAKKLLRAVAGSL